MFALRFLPVFLVVCLCEYSESAPTSGGVHSLVSKKNGSTMSPLQEVVDNNDWSSESEYDDDDDDDGGVYEGPCANPSVTEWILQEDVEINYVATTPTGSGSTATTTNAAGPDNIIATTPKTSGPDNTMATTREATGPAKTPRWNATLEGLYWNDDIIFMIKCIAVWIVLRYFIHILEACFRRCFNNEQHIRSSACPSPIELETRSSSPCPTEVELSDIVYKPCSYYPRRNMPSPTGSMEELLPEM